MLTDQEKIAIDIIHNDNRRLRARIRELEEKEAEKIEDLYYAIELYRDTFNIGPGQLSHALGCENCKWPTSENVEPCPDFPNSEYLLPGDL